MGVAPQHLLELDRRMLEAIVQVYKQRAKAVEDAKRRARRRR
jgi:hypothetical protein